MIDGILSGLFGGLFGPAIARWLSRFKYWVTFIVATLFAQAVTVVCMLRNLGFEKTVNAFATGIDPAFFYASFIIGVLAMLIAFVGSINAVNEGHRDGGDKQGP